MPPRQEARAEGSGGGSVPSPCTRYVCTEADPLNVRDGPSRHAPWVYRLDRGEAVTVHEVKNGWAYVERCGKPAVMLTKGDIFMSAQRGASARHVPHLRFVKCTLQDLSFVPALDEALINDTIRPAVAPPNHFCRRYASTRTRASSGTSGMACWTAWPVPSWRDCSAQARSGWSANAARTWSPPWP